MKTVSRLLTWLSFLLVLPVASVQATFVEFTNQNGGLSAFNTVAGNPPVTIDFDSIATGTDLNGTILSGVQFSTTSTGAPLIVVPGADTVTPPGFTNIIDPATNRLLPTTENMVLSPGGTILGPGPDNPIENDDLVLNFLTPVAAFGFDFLSQSADGWDFATIFVFNQNSDLIFSDTIPISNLGGHGSPGTADFWGGFASGTDLISRILIDESDNNAENPDSNIGFDTFRFNPPGKEPVIPEPGTISLIGLGMAGFWTIKRRRRSKANLGE